MLFQGKALVRPIAFRPTPGRPSSVNGGVQPPSRPGSSVNGGVQPPSRPGSSAPSPAPAAPSHQPNPGFVPGHPLATKDGPRPFGSKLIVLAVDYFQ